MLVNSIIFAESMLVKLLIVVVECGGITYAIKCHELFFSPKKKDYKNEKLREKKGVS